MGEEYSRIEDALQALKEGRVIIVVDDEDRENEGDFIAAAEKVTPEIIEFMITHGRGLLCMPILPEVAGRLQLGPMVDHNTAPHQTPYTIPVDHVSCRTGISALERARTVAAILDPTTKPADLVRPGHLFPLVAKEGGVLRRAGHTEAAVDLARLAGLDAGGSDLRDHRRHPHGRAGEAARDRARARAADRLDRGPDQVSPPAREARASGGRGRPADPLRPRPDHRLPRPARAGQRARRVRDGRPARGGGAAGAAALLVLHGRPARLAAVRLRRPAPHGAGHDRGRGRGGPHLSAPGRARHRPDREDPRLQSPGRGPRHRPGQPRPGLPGGHRATTGSACRSSRTWV